MAKVWTKYSESKAIESVHYVAAIMTSQQNRNT
jgi:hypothetical protein